MASKKATLVLKLKDLATRGLNKIDRGLNKLSASVRGTRLGFVAAGVAVLGLGISFVKAAGQIEQWRISFTTMLGSAERADILLGKIKQFAKETPFDLPQVVKGGRALLAFGIEADKIIPTMKALGDVSAGLGVPMERLILNFGQVKAQAKLTGRELRDFAVAGVPLLAVLAKNLNVVEAEIQSMVSKGKIGFKEVEKAFISMSSEGGRFANLMEKQMDSLEGKFSNLGDVVFQVSASFGESMLPATKKVVDVFIKLGDAILRVISTSDDMLSINEIGLEMAEKEIEKLKEKRQAIIDNTFFSQFLDVVELNNSINALERIRADLKAKVKAAKIEKDLAAKKKKRLELERKGTLAAEKRISKDIIKIKQDREKAENKMRKERIDAVRTTLTFISTLTQAKTKELVLIGKAATIALIAMNTQNAASGARAALSSIPIVGPALGQAAFLAIIASGAVQAARVAGIELAEGGIVQPRPGGTIARLGEGGQAEAVIPLDDEGAGLGGITINVGVLVGSEDSVRELAVMIDEELFALKRNNESQAFDTVGSSI